MLVLDMEENEYQSYKYIQNYITMHKGAYLHAARGPSIQTSKTRGPRASTCATIMRVETQGYQ